MAHDWLRQSERSNALTLAVMSWIARFAGRSVARALLYPIAAYFVIFSPAARRSSLSYLARVRGRSATWLDVFRHYYCFASTILDRVYLLTRRHDLLDIRVHGGQLVEEHLARGTGCLLLGAHLGSFEVLRALGVIQRQLPISILMYEANALKMSKTIRAINPELAQLVIPIGLPHTLLRVKEHLDRGELVGMLGDRGRKDEKSMQCNFLGGTASFPSGPGRLAHLLNVPVFLFFGLYRGGNRYDIYFERFPNEPSIASADRAALQRWTQRYADRIEFYCRLAPYNWFNFYDFWGTAANDGIFA